MTTEMSELTDDELHKHHVTRLQKNVKDLEKIVREKSKIIIELQATIKPS